MSESEKDKHLRATRALKAAMMSLYLADSSDFRNALWEVVEALDPRLYNLLAEDEKAAIEEIEQRLGEAEK